MSTTTQKTRSMIELALLAAIVLIMAYTPLGYLHTPWGVEITFITVPIAVGAIMLGPRAAAVLGLLFGLTSFAQCFGSSVLGQLFLQASPAGTFFVTVVNRVLIGLLPALLYRTLSRHGRGNVAALAVCCISVPVLNTLLYILGNWVLFHDTWLNLAGSSYGYGGSGGIGLLGFMMSLVAVNGLAEAVAGTLVSTAVCKALQRTVHKGHTGAAAA